MTLRVDDKRAAVAHDLFVTRTPEPDAVDYLVADLLVDRKSLLDTLRQVANALKLAEWGEHDQGGFGHCPECHQELNKHIAGQIVIGKHIKGCLIGQALSAYAKLVGKAP